MAKKRTIGNKRQQKSIASKLPARSRPDVPLMRQMEPKKQYGAPFILLEDEQKNTFEYLRGAWVPYGRTIAECHLDCQVSKLPQKIKQMTRYEVRPLLPSLPI